MKFGIFIPNYGKFASKKMIDTVASNAEKMEFDSIWVSDHIIVSKKLSNLFGTIYEAVSTLAYLSAKVENMILGTSVVVLPLRAIDEFDVHLDPLNKERTSMLLSSLPKSNPDIQYIFITPDPLLKYFENSNVIIVTKQNSVSNISKLFKK